MIRATSIYWLVDTRPETIAKGWTNGYPFYCGKTIFDPTKRLIQHRIATNRRSKRPVVAWLIACGQFVEIRSIEVVPAGGPWETRERHWISHLRKHYPICANVCDGGQGLNGYVPERRARKTVRKKLRRKKKPKLLASTILKRKMKKLEDPRYGIDTRRMFGKALARLRIAESRARRAQTQRVISTAAKSVNV